MKNIGWMLAVAGLSLAGCDKQESAEAGGAMGAQPPALVRVQEVVFEAVSPVDEYIAHVEPIQQVQVMAQVEGTIEEVNFEEGSRVKRGDLLFTLDAAPYKALVEQRAAELAQAKAALSRAEKYLKMISAVDGRSVAQADRDTAEANVAEGRAAVKKAEATLHQSEIDLGYTQITSPIDGRIGRALITRGNLVSPSTGPLATVIQVDPIRVVIAMPDAEYLTAFERYSSEEGYAPLAHVRLANGTVLPGEGAIAFDNNEMDASTGTMAVRLEFANPRRLLVPNAYVTALIQERNPPERVLLPTEAVMHGAQGAFVWTLTLEGTVQPTPVEAGAVMGARQVVLSGLKGGEQVVVAGVLSLRPGSAVTVMPAGAAK